jgi:hypothetical protein
VNERHAQSKIFIELVRDQLIEKIQETASRMLIENDAKLEETT